MEYTRQICARKRKQKCAGTEKSADWLIPKWKGYTTWRNIKLNFVHFSPISYQNVNMAIIARLPTQFLKCTEG